MTNYVNMQIYNVLLRLCFLVLTFTTLLFLEYQNMRRFRSPSALVLFPNPLTTCNDRGNNLNSAPAAAGELHINFFHSRGGYVFICVYVLCVPRKVIKVRIPTIWLFQSINHIMAPEVRFLHLISFNKQPAHKCSLGASFSADARISGRVYDIRELFHNILTFFWNPIAVWKKNNLIPVFVCLYIVGFDSFYHGFFDVH